ncbi:MAG: hypothetical protein ACYDCC_08685 [Actinomycetota bacterium]
MEPEDVLTGLPEGLPPLQRQFSLEDVPEPLVHAYMSYLQHRTSAEQALTELDAARVWMRQAPLDLQRAEREFMQSLCTRSIMDLEAESWIEKLRQSDESVAYSKDRVEELEAHLWTIVCKLRDLEGPLGNAVTKKARS